MLSNEEFFDTRPSSKYKELGATSAYQDSFLRACGFDKKGHRCGGIRAPRQVIVPAGAMLIRTFGGDSKQKGQWWITCHELHQLLAYLGHSDLSTGRQQGHGVLHAFLAVLFTEWKSTCEMFVVGRVVRKLHAFYGEGDHALVGGQGGHKAALMIDGGRQRGVRQLLFPRLWAYPDLIKCDAPAATVDSSLAQVCKRLTCAALPFEK